MLNSGYSHPNGCRTKHNGTCKAPGWSAPLGLHQKTSTTASFESFEQRLRRWPPPGSHCLGGCGDRTLTRACLGGTTRESACCLSMTPRKQKRCKHGNWDPLRHGTSLKIIEPVQGFPMKLLGNPLHFINLHPPPLPRFRPTSPMLLAISLP